MNESNTTWVGDPAPDLSGGTNPVRTSGYHQVIGYAPKSGIRTSEFWITLGVQLVGAALTTGLIPADHWGAKLAGAVLMAASAVGYSLARGLAKKGS